MHSKQFKILIVDDQDVNLVLLRLILEQRGGYEVLTVMDGPAAREMVSRERPDLILLDIMMPGEDGFETCRKLQEDPIAASIPVVFISALDDVANKVKGLSVGGWDYIAKPFQQDEVLARVRNYLRLSYSFKRIIEEQAARLGQIRDAQQAILVNPDDIPEARFAVHYVPILEAGGDFYNVLEIGNNVHGYFVSDISGHDLGASFATSALKALIEQNSSQLFSIEETMRMINSVLTSIFRPGQHLTAVYGYLDRNSSTLKIVNAAHPPVLVLPGKASPYWVEAQSDVVGVFEAGYFVSTEVKMDPGDRFYFYTDGLVEGFSDMSRTRDQGMAELLDACLQTRDMSIAEAVHEIVKKILPQGCVIEDDVLILGVDV